MPHDSHATHSLPEGLSLTSCLTLCATMLLLCGGCGAQSNPQSNKDGSGGMFSFLKGKTGATPSTVHPDVGAPLVRATTFPANATPATLTRASGLTLLGLDGAPPQGALSDDATAAGKTSAFIAAQTSAHPPLAFVNVRGGDAQLWELSPGTERRFARERQIHLDPEQASWVTFSLSDAAALPNERVLLAVSYHAPAVKEGLFVYDIATDQYTKVADMPWRRTLEVLRPSAETALTSYYTGTTRLAPEIYYDSPSRIRLFSSRYPQGIDVLELGASDGSIERWAMSGTTLWIASKDSRKRDQPQSFIWSLDLSKLIR